MVELAMYFYLYLYHTMAIHHSFKVVKPQIRSGRRKADKSSIATTTRRKAATKAQQQISKAAQEDSDVSPDSQVATTVTSDTTAGAESILPNAALLETTPDPTLVLGQTPTSSPPCKDSEAIAGTNVPDADTTEVATPIGSADTTLETVSRSDQSKGCPRIPGWFDPQLHVNEMTDLETTPSEESDYQDDWVKLFYAPSAVTKRMEPIDLSVNLEETLDLTYETFSPETLGQPMKDVYVSSGLGSHSLFHPSTGDFTPWVYLPTPKKKAGDDYETFTFLSTDYNHMGSLGHWWDIKLGDGYMFLSSVSNRGTTAALFKVDAPPRDGGCTGNTEISIIKCNEPFVEMAEFTSTNFTFIPQDKVKYRLSLAGDPSGNMFLVESYSKDVHFIHVVTGASTGDILPQYRLVHKVVNISRKTPRGALRGKCWWTHRILCLGQNLAILKEGQLAMWRLNYDPTSDKVTSALLPNRRAFIARDKPTQFGQYLVFARGVLDMSTFQFRTSPASRNGHKLIVWHKRDDKLIGADVSSLSNECFFLGEPQIVWLRP